MKYRIKEHLRFKLRKPHSIQKRKNHINSTTINKAYERKDQEPRFKVNVLIMANHKKTNNNESRVTANDLMKKMGRSNTKEADNIAFEEELDNTQMNKELDSIDVTDEENSEVSDSDLDINELLKKYMPEYESTKEEEDNTRSVLAQIKTASNSTNDNSDLISALDSAFSPSVDMSSMDNAEAFEEDPQYDDGEYEEEYAEEYEEEYDEEYEEEAPRKEKKGLFAFLAKLGKKSKKEPEYEEEYEEEYAEQYEEQYEEEYAEQYEEQYAEEYGDNEEYTEPAPETQSVVEEEAAYSDAPAVEDMPEETPEEVYDEYAEEGMEEAPEAEYAEDQSEEFDPTDINLMIAFGLDNESGKNADKAKALGDRLEEKHIRRTSKANALDRPEFVDKTQIPKIAKEFESNRRFLFIKLALCVVFTLILIVFENITSITKLFTGVEQQFAGVFDPAVYPVVYIMTSLQIMLLACICALDQIIDGIKYLFRGVPRPESMTTVLAIFGIIYSIVLSNIVEASKEPVMFNSVVAFSALLTLVYALYNNKREMMNFRIIANKKTKHIVRRLLDEESEGEAKAFADAEDVCDVMKIEKTDFIDGFFGRLSKSNQTTNTFMTFAMSASVAIAVLFGIFMNFRGADGATVWGVIYSALLILAPLSIFITCSYPFYRANYAAREYDSAIIGENSLEEYSNASIISFDDKNVFPSYSVKVQNIRIYNNARIDRVLYYASSVFAYAGGPLQDVFEVATKDMGNSDNVQIFDTEAGFLATQVDGVNIIFGNHDALVGRGLEIPVEAAEDDVDLSDELSIMYMFRESKLVAKMYIKYVMDGDIDLILKQFSGNGLYVCVRTFDPNIDERMIAKKLNMKRMPLKIVRYANAEEVGRYEEKVDSGLVTCGSPKSLLQVISYCGKVLHTKKTNIALSVLSVMISIAILLLLTISNTLGSLSSLFIIIYQLVWVVPMIVSSKVFIR